VKIEDHPTLLAKIDKALDSGDNKRFAGLLMEARKTIMAMDLHWQIDREEIEDAHDLIDVLEMKLKKARRKA
jgi:hypothetical protein